MLATEEDVLVDKNGVEVCEGHGIALAGFRPFPGPSDDAGEERHRFVEIPVDVVGVPRQRRSYDCCTASEVTDQPSKIGVGFEERFS